jgi:hypothetical protein
MLADLVPLILETKAPRRLLTRTEINRRYRQRNREKWLAYRRAWYAKNKPGNV